MTAPAKWRQMGASSALSVPLFPTRDWRRVVHRFSLPRLRAGMRDYRRTHWGRCTGGALAATIYRGGTHAFPDLVVAFIVTNLRGNGFAFTSSTNHRVTYVLHTRIAAGVFNARLLLDWVLINFLYLGIDLFCCSFQLRPNLRCRSYTIWRKSYAWIFLPPVKLFE